jgi:hypothetical protein
MTSSTCQRRWTLAGLTVLCIGSGSSCLRSVPTACEVGNAIYPADTPNPEDACQVCRPAIDPTGWTPLPNGTACGGTGFCAGGACQTGCLIAGVAVSSGVTKPRDACQECRPSQRTDDWSPVPDGTPCDAGQCRRGICQPPPDCVIAGVGYFRGDSNPENPCQSCNPSLDRSQFSLVTGLAPAGGCDGGSICLQGRCASGCLVDGGLQLPGAVNPGNACQVCTPTRSGLWWSDQPDGNPCGDAGGVCAAGLCLDGCAVGGAIYSIGAGSPGNACETCQPNLTPANWSPFTGIPPGGCDGGQVCAMGACLSACFIDGGLLTSRTSGPGGNASCCNPSANPASWTPLMVESAKFPNPDGFHDETLFVVGDFNRDGRPDLALMGSTKLAFYFNLGGGLFNGPQQITSVSNTGDYPVAMAAGDIDGDGFPDIVFSDIGSGKVSVLRYQGGAGLSSQIDVPLDGGSAFEILMTDLNHDGLADIVTYNGSGGGSVSVFLATGDGGLTPEQSYSSFDPPSWYGPVPTPQIVAADFNGDGIPDLAVVSPGAFSGNPGVILLYNDGQGGFQGARRLLSLPNASPDAISVGDFNGDGRPDLAVGDTNGTGIHLFLSTGLDTFGSPLTIPLDLVVGMAVADLNGDGRPDLMVGSRSGQLIVLINSGDTKADGGIFLPFSYLDTLTYEQYVRIVATDMNGDGAPDVLLLETLTQGRVAEFSGAVLYLNGCP